MGLRCSFFLNDVLCVAGAYPPGPSVTKRGDLIRGELSEEAKFLCRIGPTLRASVDVSVADMLAA